MQRNHKEWFYGKRRTPWWQRHNHLSSIPLNSRSNRTLHSSNTVSVLSHRLNFGVSSDHTGYCWMLLDYLRVMWSISLNCSKVNGSFAIHFKVFLSWWVRSDGGEERKKGIYKKFKEEAIIMHIVEIYHLFCELNTLHKLNDFFTFIPFSFSSLCTLPWLLVSSFIANSKVAIQSFADNICVLSNI